jgi:hypothetical protein
MQPAEEIEEAPSNLSAEAAQAYLDARTQGLCHEGALMTVLTEFEDASLPVHVIHREGRQGPAKVRSFVDLAVERLRANTALK